MSFVDREPPIDDLGKWRVRLTHGEEFRGALVPLLRGTLDNTERGFVLMNEGLNEQAEKPAKFES